MTIRIQGLEGNLSYEIKLNFILKQHIECHPANFQTETCIWTFVLIIK